MSSRDFACATNCANDEKCTICGPCGERADEKAFKRGYDQGRLDEKTANPTPKAKQYRDERDVLAEALKRHAQLARTLAANPDLYTPEHLERRLAEADAALAKVTR